MVFGQFRYTVVASNDTDPSWLLGCFYTKEEAIDAMIEDVLAVAEDNVDVSEYEKELRREYEVDNQLNRVGWYYYVCELKLGCSNSC
jgi:hypothetical protein